MAAVAMDVYLAENLRHYNRVWPVEGNEELQINEDSTHTVQVGNALAAYLKDNFT